MKNLQKLGKVLSTAAQKNVNGGQKTELNMEEAYGACNDYRCEMYHIWNYSLKVCVFKPACIN